MADNAQRNAQIIELRKQGIGPREISRRLDVSPNVVAGVLHRAGFANEKKGRGHAIPPELRAATLALAKIIGPEAAARVHGVSARTIYDWRQDRAA